MEIFIWAIFLEELIRIALSQEILIYLKTWTNRLAPPPSCCTKVGPDHLTMSLPPTYHKKLQNKKDLYVLKPNKTLPQHFLDLFGTFDIWYKMNSA